MSAAATLLAALLGSGIQLDDGWPESETCDCPALSKRYIEREKERADVKE